MSSTGNTFPKTAPKPQKRGNTFPNGDREKCLSAALAQATAAALKAEVGSDPSSVKVVMGWTGAASRTVKHWLAGSHPPSAAHLIDLAQHSDRVLYAFLQLAGRSPDELAARVAELRDRLLQTTEFIDKHF